MAISKELVINAAWCKGCGICVAFCPKKALAIKQEKVVLANPGECVRCGQCEMRCPDYAIYVSEVEK